MPRARIPHRRERVLDAAEALVLERGFDAMSVQAIADRVGIAKGAVYLEFASKEAVVDALIERGMARLNAASAAALGGEPRPRLSVAYRVALEGILDDPLMTAAFLDDRGVLGAYADAHRGERYAARHRAVVAWVRDLQQAGALDSGVDAEGLALALSSSTIGLLSASRLLGPLDRSQLEAALAALADLVARVEREPRSGPAVVEERRRRVSKLGG